MTDMINNFSCTDQNGDPFDLYKALESHSVLLYFYPKDLTSGCTVQAEGFRDISDQLAAHNVRVVGVSKDSAQSHCRFIEKHKLNFDLLVDEDTKIAQQFGCWVKKSMYGREYMGVERSTFLIGQDRVLKQAWRGVKPKLSAQEVLEYVQGA